MITLLLFCILLALVIGGERFILLLFALFEWLCIAAVAATIWFMLIAPRLAHFVDFI